MAVTVTVAMVVAMLVAPTVTVVVAVAGVVVHGARVVLDRHCSSTGVVSPQR
jgi:hypothetical protein